MLAPERKPDSRRSSEALAGRVARRRSPRGSAVEWSGRSLRAVRLLTRAIDYGLVLLELVVVFGSRSIIKAASSNAKGR